MPRWRVPVEVTVEAESPAAARAHLVQQLSHLATAEQAAPIPVHYAVAPAAPTATPPQPLTTRRTTAASQRQARDKRPS
jgi:hypothetical protein